MKWDDWHDVPQDVVEKTKTLKTYQKLAYTYCNKNGMRYEDMTDDDWRQVYYERSVSRNKYYRKHELLKMAEESVGEELPPAPDHARLVTVDQYLSYYSDPAPNDIEAIKQLVSMQNQLVIIDERIQAELEAEELSTKRWGDLAKIQKELSAETRLLQDNLGISRKLRDSRKEQEELADYLQENIKQARELLQDYGFEIVCPHCLAKGTKILAGRGYHHFPEMGLTIKTRCHACQQEYEIVRQPTVWHREIKKNGATRTNPS